MMTTVNYGLRKITLPTAAWERITPAMAKTYLGQSGGNRNLRPRVVAAMARDMVAFLWALTGEAITFDTNGRLINGHHRLHAIVESGVAVYILVVRGAEPRAMRNMDAGIIRTFSDNLTFDGVPNSTGVAAAIRLIAQYEAGLFEGGVTTMAPSRNELMMAYERHDVSASVNAAAVACNSMRYKKRGTVASIHYVFNLISPDRCASMFAVLSGGMGDKSTRMAHQLRLTLEKESAMAGSGKPPHVVRALFCKAWNLDARGEAPTYLRHRAIGPRAEEFPVPVDDSLDPVDVGKLLRSVRKSKARS